SSGTAHARWPSSRTSSAVCSTAAHRHDRALPRVRVPGRLPCRHRRHYFSLLLLLLSLPLDVEFPLLATAVRSAFPLERVPFNRQLVIDGELVVHEVPLGGERQNTVFRLHVLELRLLLV